MKNICEILYFNTNKFDVGIVLYRKGDFVTYLSFNIFGEYDGVVLQENCSIKKICYNDKYLSFMKKIIDIDSIKDLNLITKEDFISYAINNNRILAITTKNQGIEELYDIIIEDYDGIYIKYRIYNKYGELSKTIKKVKVKNIIMMEIDSKWTRLIEKIRTD